MADIQWFPGHMAKTGRELTEIAKLTDLVLEVVDARIPRSSSNPDFNKFFSGRRRFVILNKADLADPSRSLKWKYYYRETGVDAFFTNAQRGEGIARIRTLLRGLGSEKARKQADRGVINRPVRAIVAGIPNSGKSSLINSLISKSIAKTGDKPGVTRRRQWIKLGDGIELLDTPGVLQPKFIGGETALHLAFTGAIRDEVYDKIEAAEKLLTVLSANYLPLVTARYGDIGMLDVNTPDGGTPHDNENYPMLGRAGRKRGFLLKGGLIDYERTAAIVLDEFRAAKIGLITLEEP